MTTLSLTHEGPEGIDIMVSGDSQRVAMLTGMSITDLEKITSGQVVHGWRRTVAEDVEKMYFPVFNGYQT